MKKKLVLRTESIRVMRSSQLSQVAGGTLFYTVNCVTVGTSTHTGTKSMPGACGSVLGCGGSGSGESGLSG